MIKYLSYRKRFLSLFIFFLPLVGFSQSTYHQIDSLKQLLTEGSTDSIKLDAYKYLSLAYRPVNLDTSVLYSKMAIAIAKENDWSIQQASILLQLGYLKIGLGELPESKEYLEEAMSISLESKDTFMMINVLNTIGQLNYSMERNDIAIRNLQQSYEWAMQIQHEEFIIRTSNNLGIISGMNERYEDAINYFKQTKKYALLNGNKALANTANVNIATANKELGHTDIALNSFEEVVTTSKEINDMQNLATAYLNLGTLFYDKSEFSKSLNHINKAIEISRKGKMKSIEEASLYTRAEIYSKTNKLEKATKDASEGFELAKQIGSGPANEMKYFSLLASINKDQNKYKDALYWQEKYSTRSDSLEELGRQKEIDELEISFQSKQKELENSNLKRDKANQDLIIQQRTRLGLTAGAMVLLLLLLGFLLYRNYQKTKNINTILEDKVKDRTKELETSNTLLMQSNDELKRFAFIASHDLKEPLRNMGGFVSLIKRRLLQRKDTELIEYIEFAQKSNNQMVTLVNSILEYSKLDTKKSAEKEIVELQTVVDDICSMIAQSINEKQAKINYNNLPNILFNKSTISIIIKNLIENGIKYNESDVPQIDITYKADQESFTLYIKDNGIGISKEFHSKIFEMFTRLHNRDAYSGSGMGLAFCKKLVDSHNGSIKIESAEGEGSLFIVNLPTTIVNQALTSAHDEVLEAQ